MLWHFYASDNSYRCRISEEDRLVETSRKDKWCVVQLTEYHKGNLLTRRIGRGRELIDKSGWLAWPQISLSRISQTEKVASNYRRVPYHST